MVMKCSHTFNLLDARGAISTTERAAYIGRVRALARTVAQSYYEARERLGFPLCKSTSAPYKDVPVPRERMDARKRPAKANKEALHAALVRPASKMRRERPMLKQKKGK